MAKDKPAKVVAITGASSGIGRATARLFAKKGWRVGLIARGNDALDATRREVIGEGGTAAVAPADVSDPRALERAAAQIERELGPIDVWVNDAGISSFGEFLDIPESEFRRVTEVTYLGMVNGTRVALSRMLPRDQGTIVNIGSLIAHRGFPLQTPYSGAKYAIRGFTEALRSELIHKGSNVHLTMVHPPAVNTPFFSHSATHLKGSVPAAPPPVKQPEVIADAIYLAATSHRREIKVSGITVQLAALNAIAPGLVDLALGWAGYGIQKTRRSEAKREQAPAVFRKGRTPSKIHGPFRARGWSAQMWATKHRGSLAAGLGLGLATLALLVARPKSASGGGVVWSRPPGAE